MIGANLKERDRIALVVGIGFLTVYLFYLLVYAPITHNLMVKRSQLIDKRATLAYMKQAKNIDVKKLNTVSTSQLLTLIANQLHHDSYHSYPYQLQQTNKGEIQLHFDNIPYKKFLLWLWELHEHYLVSINQLTIKRTAAAGINNVTITINVV